MNQTRQNLIDFAAPLKRFSGKPHRSCFGLVFRSSLKTVSGERRRERNFDRRPRLSGLGLSCTTWTFPKKKCGGELKNGIRNHQTIPFRSRVKNWIYGGPGSRHPILWNRGFTTAIGKSKMPRSGKAQQMTPVAP